MLVRLKVNERENSVLRSGLRHVESQGERYALKKLTDSANSAGLNLTKGQLNMLRRGDSLRLDGYIFSATSSGELGQRSDFSTARRVSDFWQHMKEHHKIDTAQIRHDPVGNYEKMLKEADPVAWKWMFSARHKSEG